MTCASSKTTCTTFVPHLQHALKRNQSNISSHEEDMSCPNRANQKLSNLDIHGFLEEFQPNQKDLRYEMTCDILLNNQRHAANWFESSRFGRLEFYVWRSGETLLQLEAPKDTSSSILRHWIRIQLYSFTHQDLPYIDPRTLYHFNGYIMDLWS